jgi:hypothetical protein
MCTSFFLSMGSFPPFLVFMFLVGASAVAATTDGRLLRRKEGKEGGGRGIAFVIVPWRHRPLTLLPKSSWSSLSLSLHTSSPNSQPSDLV